LHILQSVLVTKGCDCASSLNTCCIKPVACKIWGLLYVLHGLTHALNSA
jgi:hypothetical protein